MTTENTSKLAAAIQQVAERLNDAALLALESKPIPKELGDSLSEGAGLIEALAKVIRGLQLPEALGSPDDHSAILGQSLQRWLEDQGRGPDRPGPTEPV